MNIAQNTEKVLKSEQKCARPKMAQPASKVSLDGPKWAHVETLLPTLAGPFAPCRVAVRRVGHDCESLW